jgi:hypothetical protein
MLKCIRFYCTKPISTEGLKNTVKPKKITKAKGDRFIVRGFKTFF